MSNTANVKEGIEFQTGDNSFISFLQKKFGNDLGFDDANETKEFIAKTKSFYNAVKDSHRGQFRKTGEKYFDDHILSVSEITLNFSGSTIRDVLIALGHDFVEDHRELNYTQALQHIETTFGPNRWGPLIRAGVEKLTKFDLDEYLPTEIQELMKGMNKEEKQNFLQKNKKEFGLIRGKKYFKTLEEEGTEGEIRVKVADSVHNLMSCHTLGEEKMKKTISEKEQYLLPMVEKKGMEEEKQLLSFALYHTKQILLQKTSSKKIVGLFNKLAYAEKSEEIYTLFRNT